MGKGMNKELPTIVSAPQGVQPSVTETAASFQKIKVELVAVDVPFVTTATNGYQDSEMCKRCDLGVLSKEQSRKLRAIRRGYEYSNTRLHNGAEVKSLADAVKAWLDSVDI